MQATTRWMMVLGTLWWFSQAEAQVAVSEVWHDPNTDRIFALPAASDSAGREAAIHVSDTEGQSWTRLPGVPDGAGGEQAIATFAVIPSAGGNDVLLAGTVDNGLFRSVDSGATWTPWNDAAIGIEQISVAETSGEAAWVIADGTVYVSLDDGENWTVVAGIAGRTVTAITNGANQVAWVGTDAGEIIELAAAGSVIRVLTGNSPFSGAITALTRTTDGTLYMSIEVGDPDGSHLYRTDSADLTSFVEIQRDSKSLHIRGLTALGDSVHLLEFEENAITFVPGEAVDYLVTDDKGASFVVNLIRPMYVNQLFVGPCEGCDPWILIAHAEGVYMKSRGNSTGWHPLAAVEEPGLDTPPEPQVTNADIGVYMVSPSPTMDRIVRSTRRYQLRVTNYGPDDASGIVVEIEFATWADTGYAVISSVSSWGESATIAGLDCDREYDSYVEEILVCHLDSLAAGESASIVLTQDLPDETFLLRIDADVRASYNSDPYTADNWMYYEPSVDPDPTPGGNRNGGGNGGGGSIGLLTLLFLLVAAVRRNISLRSGRPGRARSMLRK